jgi:hypothetical protein
MRTLGEAPGIGLRLTVAPAGPVISLVVMLTAVLAGGLGSLLGVLATPSNPLGAGHHALAALVHNVELLDRIRAKAPHEDPLSGNCAAEKSAEARIGLRLGEEEIARLQGALSRNDAAEQDYALRRLKILVDRGTAVADEARKCIAVDGGSITATRVEVEIAPTIPSDTPTGPPPAMPPLDMRPPEGGPR